MKQPTANACLPTALAIISGRSYEDLEPHFDDVLGGRILDDKGWTDLEMVAVAKWLGILLCPLVHSPASITCDLNFGTTYGICDGILVGKRKDLFVNPGHAYAVKDGVLIDPMDGREHPLFGERWDNLSQKVFFAWMNKLATP